MQVRPWSVMGPMGTKSPQHLLANRRKDVNITGHFILNFNFVTFTSPLHFLTLPNSKPNVSRKDISIGAKSLCSKCLLLSFVPDQDYSWGGFVQVLQERCHKPQEELFGGFCLDSCQTTTPRLQFPFGLSSGAWGGCVCACVCVRGRESVCVCVCTRASLCLFWYSTVALSLQTYIYTHIHTYLPTLIARGVMQQRPSIRVTKVRIMAS